MWIKSPFNITVVFLLILINGISAIWFNQPKFCPTIKWNPVATTFFRQDVTYTDYGLILFIDTNNTIYISDTEDYKILVWHKGIGDPTIIPVKDGCIFQSTYVSKIHEIYIPCENKKLIKWVPNERIFVDIMDFDKVCDQLFIDVENYLYCSIASGTVIEKIWVDNTSETVVVAGTGNPGSAPNELSGASDIFVDTNLDLYVADTQNHRVQLFLFRETNGTTVAGRTSSDITITLSYPLSILLDADKYLFISDSESHRVVASGPTGFRCLVGCDGEGSQSHRLNWPDKLSFDVYGNLFVNDRLNYRVQKFHLHQDSCENVPPTAQATYSAILTDNHPLFSRTILHPSDYHYETIEVIVVSKSDFYILTANSTVDLYGHLYKHHFDPSNPTSDLIAWYGKCCNKEQFKFTLELFVNIRYILVVTTYNPNVTGSFSVTVFGSNPICLKPPNADQLVESNYRYYYEALQISVNESGFYTILSSIDNTYMDTSFYIYKHEFYALIPFANLIRMKNDACNKYDSSENTNTIELQINIRYILVVTTCSSNRVGNFLIRVSGRNRVSFERTNALASVHSNYSSELTKDSPKYDKYCNGQDFYYESIQLTVLTSGNYSLVMSQVSNGPFVIHIYMYKNHFDPLNPRENSMSIDDYACNKKSEKEFTFTADLRHDDTYMLVVTNTYNRAYTPRFSITVYGPSNVTLQRIVDDNSTRCYVGGPCNTQVKSIGLTLDDILRLEIKPNMTIHNQPLSIKISAALSVIMFVAGVINSLCSFLTFQNPNARTVGCGLYLLASSVTSLLTITMFGIKFWFVVVIQMDISVPQSVLQGGCKLIETLLKLFCYWDAWLNACVAVERAVSAYKKVSFDKEKSKRLARWIIFILPIVIMGTIIHEPLHRHIVEYKRQERREIDGAIYTEKDVVIDTVFWCITTYPQSLQDYNTAILFIHLLGPFSINLLSSLFIIIGSARRRAEAQLQQTYKQHLREQWSEHKQLVVSPILLVILSTPRLVISLLSGCIGVSHYTWLYLCGYFISFTPSILVFVVFVLPSSSYRKTFKKSFFRLCKRRRS
ncbi:unnamed protein product [Adineta ricciae]|uniref:Uncharacterized protein n=1 Tax=Adineta ricciae TaxID=249248 RepID=A0A815MQ39_ADIRI|nr:unnamed protein product [Adineta ricciae]